MTKVVSITGQARKAECMSLMRGRRWDGVVDIYTVMKFHYKKRREREDGGSCFPKVIRACFNAQGTELVVERTRRHCRTQRW